MEILDQHDEVLDVTYHRKETRYYTSDVVYWFLINGEYIGVIENRDETTRIVDGKYADIDTSRLDTIHLGSLVNFVTDEMRAE